MKYPVNDLYACVQGEGVQTGVPMILVRLHGCGVGCPWCDTKETWEFDRAQEVMTLDAALGSNPHYVWLTTEAIAQACATYPTFRWVLLTGGEPAQYDLDQMVDHLHGIGKQVALETSGTELGHLGAGLDWVCVSPKINMPGGHPFLLDSLSAADEIKMVIGKPADIEQFDALLQAAPLKLGVQVCLQPVSQSPKATRLCIETVQARGWRLSLQTHKFIAQR